MITLPLNFGSKYENISVKWNERKEREMVLPRDAIVERLILGYP
jgi:hypothetical protein